MPRKTPGPPCAVCGESSVARNLCATHYKRFKRHGHLDQTRPVDWGRRRSHPLSQTWRWMARAGRAVAWDDFWAFVGDVGDRPSPEHRLCRRNETKPFGPKNWYWADPVLLDAGTKASKSEYQRLWRLKNPLRAKGYWLKQYGITLAQYEVLLEKQNGVCAICHSKDNWARLAVDHCHGSSKVRGLLCSLCNRGIGAFKDKPELLERAAQYLRCD